MPYDVSMKWKLVAFSKQRSGTGLQKLRWKYEHFKRFR